jgi:hypothetical protein
MCGFAEEIRQLSLRGLARWMFRQRDVRASWAV